VILIRPGCDHDVIDLRGRPQDSERKQYQRNDEQQRTDRPFHSHLRRTGENKPVPKLG
jgi:hypothetical protein